jgi:type I restriction enzyme S subunit
VGSLRDALLPKLISGELRVKDAEKFINKRGL